MLAAGGNEIEALQYRPDLPAWLSFEWGAYSELRTERQIGMDVGPIPWSAIHRYALTHGVTGEDFDYFVAVMRAMEAAEIEHVNSSVQSRDRRDQGS